MIRSNNQQNSTFVHFIGIHALPVRHSVSHVIGMFVIPLKVNRYMVNFNWSEENIYLQEIFYPRVYVTSSNILKTLLQNNLNRGAIAYITLINYLNKLRNTFKALSHVNTPCALGLWSGVHTSLVDIHHLVMETGSIGVLVKFHHSNENISINIS